MPSATQFVKAAERLYACEDIELADEDDNVRIAIGGAWVQAWLFVGDHDAKVETDD